MKNQFRLAIILCGIFSLAGCVPLYTPPTSGQTAQITNAWGIYTNSRMCTNYQRFPHSFLDINPPSVTVPANQLITLELFYNTTRGSRTSGCSMVVSFYPIANHHYEVQKTLQEQSFLQNFIHYPNCIFTIVDKTTNSNVQATQRNGDENGCNDNISHGQHEQSTATTFTTTQHPI